MNVWPAAVIVYIAVAFLTFLPTLNAMRKRVPLFPGGSSFEDSPHFSDEAKKLLAQHESRIQGTLVFWKNEAEKYRNFHYYSVSWTIFASTLIPILTQVITDDPYSKLLLTIISTHSVLLLAFHRGFKVDKSFQAFRSGESDYYDLRRRLLDRPKSFGMDEKEQLEQYFADVEALRKFVRSSETDNTPAFESAKPQPGQT
jgi:hypothetical protein